MPQLSCTLGTPFAIAARDIELARHRDRVLRLSETGFHPGHD